MVPAPKVILSNAAVQLPFGHPAACGVGLAGGEVVTVNDRFPFFGSSMSTLPEEAAGVAGFCPAAWFPPGFVQTVVPVAFGKLSVTITSPFPRPVTDPVAVAVNPLSTTDGPFL